MRKLASLLILLSFAAPCFSQGALSPWAAPVFTSNGIAPLAGGFVCTTATGSTTPVQTFADPTLMTANQNPIRLNSTGQPVNGSALISIFIQPVTYRFTLYAAGTANLCNGVRVGALVRQVDNVFDFGQLGSLLTTNNIFTGTNTFNSTTHFVGNVTGTTTFTGNIVAEANVAVSGITTMTGALTSTTTGYFHGDLTTVGNAAVGKGLAVVGTTLLGSSLAVTGFTHLSDFLQMDPIAVSGLGTCNGGGEGTIIPVTDSMSATFNAAVTGSGANHVLAYCDGTSWKVH